MRFAYADPPYPGQAWRLYGKHRDYAGEVDHAELIAQLERDFPDGWVLSTSAVALQDVLPLCPPSVMSRKNKGRRLDGTGVRVLIWLKPQVPWRPVGIQWGWEPIIVRGGRPRGRERGMLRDWINCSPNGGDIVGAKPRAVCDYIFEALGAEADDELIDLFPGSGAVGDAWEAFTRQERLAVV